MLEKKTHKEEKKRYGTEQKKVFWCEEQKSWTRKSEKGGEQFLIYERIEKGDHIFS